MGNIGNVFLRDLMFLIEKADVNAILVVVDNDGNKLEINVPHPYASFSFLIITFFLFPFLFLHLFETEFFCSFVLELALVDATDICLPLPPSAGIKGMCHHHPSNHHFLYNR